MRRWSLAGLLLLLCLLSLPVPADVCTTDPPIGEPCQTASGRFSTTVYTRCSDYRRVRCDATTGTWALEPEPEKVVDKTLEGDLEICDYESRGHVRYIAPEIDTFPSRGAMCMERTDGSGFDW